jgi:GT2 family glycosyltransferase
VAVVTRDRRERLLETLASLAALPERPAVVVVDNGSVDGTAAAVRERFPAVDVVALGRNVGAAGRTIAAQRLAAPYVAFNDDDSCWEPGALSAAADVLDASPWVALLAARVLVGAEGRVDPVCCALAASPLVLGFLACGAVVRRTAFLGVGGFHPRYGVGGEEELLVLDLRARGWDLVYDESVVTRHWPASGPRVGRSATQVRNRLWTAWLRRPPSVAVRSTLAALAATATDTDADTRRAARRGLAAAARGLPWVIAERGRSFPVQ